MKYFHIIGATVLAGLFILIQQQTVTAQKFMEQSSGYSSQPQLLQASAAPTPLPPTPTPMPTTNTPTEIVAGQSPATDIPPGIDINHPLSLEMGVNEGNLGAGEKRWFSIEAMGPGGGSGVYVPLTLSLYFTPNDGNPRDRVSMELFDSSMPAIWSKGYPNQIKSFGAGSVRSLDNDDKSGEMIWSGSLIGDQPIYIRLRNDNEFPVDYLLFTFDIF